MELFGTKNGVFMQKKPQSDGWKTIILKKFILGAHPGPPKFHFVARDLTKRAKKDKNSQKWTKMTKNDQIMPTR